MLPYFKKFGITIDRNNVSKLIQEEYYIVRNQIKEITKDRILSIKIDLTKRHRRVFMSVNINLVINETVKFFLIL